jgi:hypothetical protein
MLRVASRGYTDVAKVNNMKFGCVWSQSKTRVRARKHTNLRGGIGLTDAPGRPRKVAILVGHWPRLLAKVQRIIAQ